jgi:hypothetical protein
MEEINTLFFNREYLYEIIDYFPQENKKDIFNHLLKILKSEPLYSSQIFEYSLPRMQDFIKEHPDRLKQILDDLLEL